jgi:hypothetical protein
MLKSARLLFESTAVPCTVLNLSEIGCCLEVETTIGIPEIFQIVIANQSPRTCKVLWRDSNKLGVYLR